LEDYISDQQRRPAVEQDALAGAPISSEGDLISASFEKFADYRANFLVVVNDQDHEAWHGCPRAISRRERGTHVQAGDGLSATSADDYRR
jgi:hypothetical protein